jgi:hypothetical protein
MAKKFFHFHQNNSGGYTHHDMEKGIGTNVWIEADDYTQANAIAERIGLYWNGVSKGCDCECCGDRWYPLDDWHEAYDKPDEIGYYTEKAYAHYADGRIVPMKYVSGYEVASNL